MSPGDLLAWLATAGAGLAAVGYLFRKVRAFARWISTLVETAETLLALARKELEHNHGSSIKDDVHGTALSVDHLAHRVDDLYDALATLAEANHLIWPAIEAVANARPPVDPEKPS